jgi:ribosomal protein L25 (general stress protein Ctc)
MAATLTVAPRSERGKNAARALRRSGRVPAVMYGHGEQTREISVDALELERLLSSISVENTLIDLRSDGGATTRALIREVQWHPFKPIVLHVDHRLRPSSAGDAHLVCEHAAELGLQCEVLEVDVVRQRALHQRPCGGGDQYLPAVGGVGDPRRTVHVDAHEGVPRHRGLTGMDAQAGPDGRILRPRLVGQRALRCDRCGDRASLSACAGRTA